MKKPVLTLLLLFLTVGLMKAQEKSAVDFTQLQAEITISPEEKKVVGDLVFTFDVLQATDSIFIDAQNMIFHEVLLNGKSIDFNYDQEKLWLQSRLRISEDNQLKIKYTVYPEQTMYFIKTRPKGEEQEYQVWTQGQGKYTSYWLPSFDDPTEKLEFDLTVLYKRGYKVAANGLLLNAVDIDKGMTRWEFDMKKPMSSYLVAVAAGNFNFQEVISKNGVAISLFYPLGKAELVEPTYRYTAEMMDFFENEIGVAYPWQDYKQIPVQDFLYAGMENTGTTIFSDGFMVDSVGFHDRNYVKVNAHELAHQWFGNMVTAASGEHHWLQEGFATYYALLAEREIFGEDYFYWQLYQSAEELKQMSDSGKGESLMNPKAGSLTFYQKGAWALHILKEMVGKEAFNMGVKNYLLKYAFATVTTEDFLAEMAAASQKDLSVFRKNWLEQTAFQGSDALKALEKSNFIKEYLKIAALKQLPLEKKIDLLKTALDFPVNDFIGQEVVHQLALEDASAVIDVYKKAFESNNLYVRQAIALSLQDIPQELKTAYETLLSDESYITQEAALYTLWMNFPKDRERYFSKLKERKGFLDKNIRTLWLALNIATPSVKASRKNQFLSELSSYTAPHFRFQLRENAFRYLFQLNAFSSKNIHDLVEASKHHNYKFREYAKRLRKMLLDMENLPPEYRALLEEDLRSKPTAGY